MSARLRSGMGSGGMWAMGRLGWHELGLGGRLRVFNLKDGWQDFCVETGEVEVEKQFRRSIPCLRRLPAS